MNRISLSAVLLVVFGCAKTATPPEAVSETAAAPSAAAEEAPPVVENPFFEASWSTPYGAPPFDRIDEKHYAPAFDRGMEKHLEEIDLIAGSSEPPTFDNTIVAMERSGELLTRVSLVFFNLAGTDLTDGIQELRSIYAPKLSQHQDSIVLNEALFARVLALYEQRETLGLNAEQTKLIEDYHRDFVRAGATVQGEDKERLKAINTELATLFTEYQSRLLKENNYLLVIDDEADLDGLSEEIRASAAGLASERGQDGKWAFTLVRSSYEPFLKYATNRARRKELWEAFHNRGSNDGDQDTRGLAIQIATLRAERAPLLGYPNHASYIIEGNMAGKPDAVFELMNKLFKGSLTRMKEDRAELQKLMRKDLKRRVKLQPWDWRYYTEKLRKSKYDLSEEELKPYFPVDSVRQGAFDTASRLFGITFEEVTDSVPRFHPDVKAFDVKNSDGSHVGLLYVDYFPRESKRSGAWMTVFRAQRNLDAPTRPVVVNVGNFPAPSGDKPALLGWSEVVTLFHEFGHALHGLLSDVTYPRFAGTSVKRDYVEFPSQLLENWAQAPEVIKNYAKHYETGEPIPDALVEKIRKSSQFNQGFEMGEYVAAALLDLEWHTRNLEETKKIKDVNAFDQAAMKKIGMIPEVAPRYYSPYFQHIFASDGYSAGYYVYGWAQVLEADAFHAFEEKGDVFDPELSAKLREHIFSSGSSREEMQLYTNFRGQPPSVEPLLEKRGLLGG